MEDIPSPDELLASAVKYVIENHDEESAGVLLSCHLERASVEPYGYNGQAVFFRLRGPAFAYNLLSDWYNTEHGSVARRVWAAFQAVCPFGYEFGGIGIRAERANIGPDWKVELAELAKGKAVDNQAAEAETFTLWNNLRFRSATEVKIAQSLDRAGVLFFPLCKGRVTNGKMRVNREPDFLVCHNGRWGIIEVDGEPWHPPSRTTQDHERDRLFRSHGVKVVEHFDANQCYDLPDLVVEKFLTILEKV